MRAPSITDFQVVSPALGTFVYGRKTFGDKIAIRRRYLELLQTNDDSDIDPDLAAMCGIIAAHDVMCVKAPDGWEDLAKVDVITDPGNEALLLELYALLRQKEDSFRRQPTQGGAG